MSIFMMDYAIYFSQGHIRNYMLRIMPSDFYYRLLNYLLPLQMQYNSFMKGNRSSLLLVSIIISTRNVGISTIRLQHVHVCDKPLWKMIYRYLWQYLLRTNCYTCWLWVILLIWCSGKQINNTICFSVGTFGIVSSKLYGLINDRFSWYTFMYHLLWCGL